MRITLFAVVAVLLLPAIAAAQARTVLAVVLNRIPQEDAFVITTEAGAWIAVADLEAMGLTGFTGRRQDFDGVQHVLLPSLAPALTAEIDLRELSMVLLAEPGLFQATQLAGVPVRPPDIQYRRSFSSFMNYRLAWNSDVGTSGSADTGVSLAGHSLRTTGAWSTAGAFSRGVTVLTLDRPSSRFRAELGDVTARWSSPLSSGTLVGGITLGRDNSLDPYYQQYHVPAFTGSATLSSTAELYVNGMLQRTYELNPGMFRIDGLPVTAGRGDILVRVRDELGQVVDLNRSYYLSTQLLAAGRHDFRLTSGLKRRDLDGRVTYANWAAVGGHRVGVTEWLTLGTFAEGDRDSIAGGGEISLGAPVLGELNLSGAVSRDRAATLGYAASASWSLTMRHLSLSASGQWRGETYHGLEDPPGNRTQPWSARAFIGVPLGGIGSFAIEAAAQDLIEVTLPSSAFELPAIVESRVGRIGMRTDVRVLRGVNLRASAYWTRNVTSKERYWEGTVGLVLSPGARVSMSAEMTRDRQRDLLLTDVNRPLSRDRGLGFRLRGVGPLNARDQRVQGQLDMQNSLARATVTHERDFTGNSSSSAFLEGGIIQVGPAVALSRPVNSSFALVKVPDVRGVTVYRDHDVVGRTGRAGRFLVPDLQAYYGNVLSIEDTDLPLDVLVNQTRQVVAPPFRGGATVVFPTKRLRAYTGTVRLDPWPSTRARYGTIFFRRAETELTSPLGADGSFYLDGAEPGPYDVEIEMGDASCRLTVTVPAGTGMTTPIGEIVCRVNGSGGTP